MNRLKQLAKTACRQGAVGVNGGGGGGRGGGGGGGGGGGEGGEGEGGGEGGGGEGGRPDSELGNKTAFSKLHQLLFSNRTSDNN